MKYIINILAFITCLQVSSAQQAPFDGYSYPIDGYEEHIYNGTSDKYNFYPIVSGIATNNIHRNGGHFPDNPTEKVWFNVAGVYTTYNGGLHPGEDWNKGNIGEDVGEPVYAIANGIVRKIKRLKYPSWNMDVGWMIIIEHTEPDGDSIYSLYLHVTHDKNPQNSTDNTQGVMITNALANGEYDSSAFTYQVGETVNRGDVIARLATGIYGQDNAPMGEHLHFEIRKGGVFNINRVWENDNNDSGYYSNINNMLLDGVLEPSNYIDAYLSDHYVWFTDVVNNAWYKSYVRFLRENKVTVIDKQCEDEKTNLINSIEMNNGQNNGSSEVINYKNCIESNSEDMFLIDGFEDINIQNNGNNNIQFNLTRTVTRKEMAKLVTLIGLKANRICTLDDSGTPFGDVQQSDPYFPYIQTLKNLGVVSGIGNNSSTFAPEALVKRDEMAKFMVNALCIPLLPPDEYPDDLTDENNPKKLEDIPTNQEYNNYSQQEKEEKWWFPYVRTLLNIKTASPIEMEDINGIVPEGIISGDEGNRTYRPKNSIIRAEMAKILVNCYVYAMGNYGTPCYPCDTNTSNLEREDGNSVILKSNTNTQNNYIYLGYNFEQTANASTNPPQTLTLPTATGNSIQISPVQDLVLSHPSFYDSDSDELFFYWVTDDGNLVANNSQYQSVTFEPPNVSSPTTVNLFTLSGDGNGNISKLMRPLV